MDYEPSATPPPIPPRYPAGRPPARSRRGGRGWMICSLILAFLLIMTLAAHYVSRLNFAGSSSPSSYGLSEVLVEDNDSRNKILKIQVNGVITSEPFDRSGNNLVDLIDTQLRLAAWDPNVRGIILSVDSPGGEVLAADEIRRLIKEFQEDYQIPVVAAMNSLAASGGYYISAPCQWIVAHELTLTGSIGVIMSGYNYRGLMDKVGVEPLVFKSGRFKDMLSATKPVDEISPEEREMIQALVDDTYERFKQVVKEGREQAFEKNENFGAQPLSADWTDYADGRILSGKQAFEYGFIDEMGNFDTAFERTLKLAGIRDANLVEYKRPVSFSSLFRFLGQAQDRETTVQLDLGLNIPQLKMGRMYFLPGGLMQLR